MIPRLPLNAREIYVTWWTAGGGVGITAYTDEAGLPYIGLYPIDEDAEPSIKPFYFQRSQLISNIVVSHTDNQPSVAFIDIEVTQKGLEVKLIPPLLKDFRNSTRRLVAHWDDEKALYQAPKGVLS
jgi:hypothetical protein